MLSLVARKMIKLITNDSIEQVPLHHQVFFEIMIINLVQTKARGCLCTNKREGPNGRTAVIDFNSC